MRGSDERSGSLFSYVDLEARVGADHPLRVIREIANVALIDLSRAFAALYTDVGRPSIEPEKLLRAMLLQTFYGSPTAKLMVFKLVNAAAKTWRRLNGENQLPKVVQGVKFQNGIEVTEMPAHHAA